MLGIKKRITNLISDQKPFDCKKCIDKQTFTIKICYICKKNS